MTAKRKYPRRRKSTKPKPKRPTYKPRRTRMALTRRRNLTDPGPPAKPNGCQHPKSRARGVCQCKAVGAKVDGQFVPTVFDIPQGYVPEVRHSNQPQLPQSARLCTQHKFLIEAFNAGDTSTKDFSHRSQCAVCGVADQAKVKRMEKFWITGAITATGAAAELGVSVLSFKHHCYYYELDKRKADKDNTRKMLLDAAEQGLATRTHSAKTGLQALAQLSRERGDVLNVNAQVATVDLGTLSTAEIAKRNVELAAKLAALEAGANDE
jgi:hypothetical protein